MIEIYKGCNIHDDYKGPPNLQWGRYNYRK